MSRPGHNKNDKLDAHITYLRRAVLKAERTLAHETKKREMPCRCQGGGYIYTQEDFEEMRGLFEMMRAHWLADHALKIDTEKINIGNTETRLIESAGNA